MSAASGVTAILGSSPVTSLFRVALRGRLRVLAYHDVRDQAAFAEHVRHLSDHYRPVCADDVRAAQQGRRLPDRAVWLTFDDANPDVVELAMPVLDRAGISAMLFVCPGLVDTRAPYWWQVVDAAISRDLHRVVAADTSAPAFRARLKLLPDPERRAVVARLTDALEDAGPGSTEQRQVTSGQLRRWTAAGHDLGNHTWDHPLLDRCSSEEQRRQVAEADEFLRQFGPRPLDFFAYPNGNVAPASEAELRARRYQAPLLFDHGASRLPASHISRLRLDAFAPPARMRAIASGAHHVAFTAQRAVRRG